MRYINSRSITVSLKVYLASALIAAAILSHPALSFVPMLLFIAYIFLWRWPIRAAINLLMEYFIFFTIIILLAPYTGPGFSLLISLPALILITKSLQETAYSHSYRTSKYARSPTSIGVALPLIALLALCVSLLLGSMSLLWASITIIAYFGALGAFAVRKIPLKPVQEIQARQRMVAGTEGHLQIELIAQTKIGGTLFLESPYEWLKIDPSVLPLKGEKLTTEVSLSPISSGPSIVKIQAYAIDRWGLIQTKFELEPVRLYVIPRARYATWLARRYLAENRVGALPLMASTGTIRPVFGLRRGVEYYGSQLYQPGDSLKNIDWKHSLKYNELISKEYAEFHSQPAMVLINLAAGDSEEADKLIYNIITTAISLAQENIPAVLAAYDHERVKVTTEILEPRQLLIRSLEVAQEVAIFSNPFRYLGPPDVKQLKADINRVRFIEGKASSVLAQLLQLEYENLKNNARLNPASKALLIGLDKAGRHSNVVIVSQYNHDAEALSLYTYNLANKGSAVMSV
jgi:hypothetical protein